MKWNVVTHLMAKLGCRSQKAFADLLGRRENVISDWKRKNMLPDSETQLELIRIGQARGVHIVPDDFFPPDLRADSSATEVAD